MMGMSAQPIPRIGEDRLAAVGRISLTIPAQDVGWRGPATDEHLVVAAPIPYAAPSDDAGPYAGIRLTELIAALSHALDMAEGQPVGHSVRTAMIGMRIGRCIGLAEQAQSALFYALLLKDLGGSSSSSQLASIHGRDDRAFKAARKFFDWTERS